MHCLYFAVIIWTITFFGTSVLCQNPETDDNKYYQGDIVLTEEQYELIESEESERKAIKELAKRWPNAIVPYIIDQKAKDDGLDEIIVNATEEWMANSCLRFVPATDFDAPYITFTCCGLSSLLGMNGIGQKVFLRSDGGVSSAVHEIGHAIGFIHEQSRPDRDDYITVLYDNIDPHLWNQYNKMSPDVINTYGVPYDYDSIMHYGREDNSVNGEFTLKTKKPEDLVRTGQHIGLSFYDMKLANLMYNCMDQCPVKLDCGNGFMHPSCTYCICPSDQPNCQRGGPSSPGPKVAPTFRPPFACGGTLTEKARISLPEYHPPNTVCEWKLIAAADHYAYFDVLGGYKLTDDECVEFTYGAERLKEKHCGEEIQRGIKIHRYNPIIVTFTSLGGGFGEFSASTYFLNY